MIRNSRTTRSGWGRLPAGANSPRRTRPVSRRAGAFGFGSGSDDVADKLTAVIWTPEALPSVVRLSAAPRCAPSAVRGSETETPDGFSQGHDHSFRYDGEIFRFHVMAEGDPTPMALLSFDDLFDLRATAAVRLKRALAGKSVGGNPAALTRERQARLVLALRALDARLEGVTNREISAELFPHIRVPPEAWISHDLRDRTARLVRLGIDLMRGGYRRLLVYPRRLRQIR